MLTEQILFALKFPDRTPGARGNSPGSRFYEIEYPPELDS